MARILICEPHAEVHALYRHVVARLGHEPVDPGGEEGGSVDLILLEPADPRSLATAQGIRLRAADVPIVCASIKPRNGHLASLKPSAYLLKPFSLPDLQAAIARALAR